MAQDLLDYESRTQPVASMGRYIGRVLGSFLMAAVLIGASLAAGMLGYAHFEGMSWLDAFLNASMILSGKPCAENSRRRGREPISAKPCVTRSTEASMKPLSTG